MLARVVFVQIPHATLVAWEFCKCLVYSIRQRRRKLEPGVVLRLIILFILILLSAFFSSAETAFMSVNKIILRSKADEGSKRAGLVLALLDNNTKLLSTILVGNNLVNIIASSLTTTLMIRLFGSTAVGIATGILTLIILIFGEITPKTPHSS